MGDVPGEGAVDGPASASASGGGKVEGIDGVAHNGGEESLASYDLSQRMCPYWDIHMIFPLISFLEELEVGA